MTAAEPVVFVVDDDRSVLVSLGRLLESAGFAVQTFGSAQEFLRSPRPDVPGCLVLDVCLPGMTGLELQAELSAIGVETPIVFITGHGDIATSVRAMKAGAVEFLTKPLGYYGLIDAIREAFNRARSDRWRTAELADLRARYETLTPRERQVMDLIAGGMLNKQVGALLGTTEKTVKFHRANVMRKMGVGSLADLVRAAGALAGVDRGRRD